MPKANQNFKIQCKVMAHATATASGSNVKCFGAVARVCRQLPAALATQLRIDGSAVARCCRCGIAVCTMVVLLWRWLPVAVAAAIVLCSPSKQQQQQQACACD